MKGITKEDHPLFMQLNETKHRLLNTYYITMSMLIKNVSLIKTLFIMPSKITM